MMLKVVGVLAGSVVSHLYSVRAAEDMKLDADERIRVDERPSWGNESAGDLRYSLASNGEVIFATLKLRGQAPDQAMGTGALTITPVSNAEP
jgi:hypothetical protein